MGLGDSGPRELGGDAERLGAQSGEYDFGLEHRLRSGRRWREVNRRVGEEMTKPPKVCIYPGCERPVVPPHPRGGPPSSFCDLEEHNALTSHQERQRLAAAASVTNEEADDDR